MIRVKHNRLSTRHQRYLHSISQRRHRIRFAIPIVHFVTVSTSLLLFLATLFTCSTIGISSAFASFKKNNNNNSQHVFSFSQLAVGPRGRPNVTSRSSLARGQALQRLFAATPSGSAIPGGGGRDSAGRRESNDPQDEIEKFRRSLERSIQGDRLWREKRARLVHEERSSQQDTTSSLSLFDPISYAHPVDRIEEGCVLLANERMGGRLYRAVLVVISHDERMGTTAVSVNRLLSGNVQTLSQSDPATAPVHAQYNSLSSIPVTYGGSQSSFYQRQAESTYTALHNNAMIRGSRQIIPGLLVGGTAESLDRTVHRFRRSNGDDTEEEEEERRKLSLLLARGYSSFAPSQLEREVSQGVWYLAAASPDFVLHHANCRWSESSLEDHSDDHKNDDDIGGLWNDIMMAMGGKYADIAKRSSKSTARRSPPSSSSSITTKEGNNKIASGGEEMANA